MTVHLDPQEPEPDAPTRIADRYQVRALLGRGGMASVYRVTDLSNGRELALKQLERRENPEQHATFAALFEREFHTLAQLSHPSVIAVYEYGVTDHGPYYTMELLDGGDLRDRSPMPWAEVCRLLFDVCSSLSLLHSRRLLHRDVSPRNIRCTQSGAAKLIDFGAMCAMGGGNGQLVGTPAFVAPESVQRSAIDGRTDLFSLGATMYFALTKELAFPARSFAEVLHTWSSKPAPPSAHVPGIPAALDELVLSLLSIDPALRPQSTFEVMQRLAAIAGLPRSEPEGVSRAYLSTPMLVGRDDVMQLLRRAITRALIADGSGVMVRADAGLGRSRILDACALEAKMLGATVLRATPNGAHESFSLALQLTERLLEALPNAQVTGRLSELIGEQTEPQPARELVRRVATLRDDPAKLQQGLTRFLIAVSRTHPLVIAIDDVQQIDDPSAALLVALLDKARRGHVLVAMTAPTDATSGRAIAALARRTEAVQLPALTRDQTHSLLDSMFGDVPNLGLLTDEIFKVARGNPRQIMDLAQHLLDKRSISYASGGWTLPRSFSDADMPRSAEAALIARTKALDPTARGLAEAHSLAFLEIFSREEYQALRPDLDARAIDSALLELLRHQVIVEDGGLYGLTSRVWTAALRAGLSEASMKTHHQALAEIYRERAPAATIHHLFCAGLDERGLDALVARHKDYERHFDLNRVVDTRGDLLGPSYLRGLQTAERLGRAKRELFELRRWLVALSVTNDTVYYVNAAPALLAQAKLDSGLSSWERDPDTSDAGARITRALESAQARYLATPENERVFRADEAIRQLAEFAAVSIAIGSRMHDYALLCTLPSLLEPFVPFSVVIHAIWQNVIATCEANQCRFESARERWLDVYAKLNTVSPQELKHAASIRSAVAYGMGMMDA
ncbi:MAG TPA: protein kinase, partial [Polyangiales bacterium]|nr:protein kinase [Polyangiales bacterium]